MATEEMKPILFNTEMVKAILEGRKTVTRRVVKPRSKNASGFYVVTRQSDGAFMGVYDCDENEMMYENSQTPPANVGDVLYVRETWYKGLNRILYKANYSENEKFYTNGKETIVKWKPSIHMPKEAARIFLKVTDVRVERLQEIDIEGIRNEGLSSMAVHAGDMEIALEEWKILWDSTIKKDKIEFYGWEANPYVWVIEFEKIEI